jgi:hypothetical protein
MSSIESAPATIPATKAGTFKPALPPPGLPIDTCPATNSCKPDRSASNRTGAQTRARHEVRIIEHRREPMTDSHLPDALPLSETDP